MQQNWLRTAAQRERQAVKNQGNGDAVILLAYLRLYIFTQTHTEYLKALAWFEGKLAQRVGA